MMAKKSFKISDTKLSAKCTLAWSICLDDIPKKLHESYLDNFAESFRLAKLTNDDFIIRRIRRS